VERGRSGAGDRPEPLGATLWRQHRIKVVDRLDTERFSMDLLRIIIAILLPPLGVFLQVGIGKHFWINILLRIFAFSETAAQAAR
jgi:uncharacterized membrane protein YqaE (UPF0057 family)